MLADGQAVYKYNTANKLVGVTKGTSNIVYAYSSLGDRLHQIADGVTTDYTLNINAGLTQVPQVQYQKNVYLIMEPLDRWCSIPVQGSSYITYLSIGQWSTASLRFEL
jgi:hypothetical protein